VADPQLPLTPGYEPARIEARIQAFEDLGIHRTGWPADDQTTQWLIDELAAAGVESESERFSFPRVEVRRAEVRVGTDRIEGVPLYDAGFTDAGGLDGEICEDTDDDPFGKIVLATSALRDAPEWADRELGNRIDEFAQRGCLGLIVPRGDRDREIVLRNAHRIESPHVLPVLQIAPRDTATLQSQIVIGGEVDFEADGDRLRSNATNVLATIEGTDPDLSPIGIVTPKSGWFTCAAERGGGIAVFLALAESLAVNPLPRTVHLLASSGHELDFYGIRSYARTHRDHIAGAAGWLHLGASIGAREPRPAVAASDDALDELMIAAVEAQQLEPAVHRPPGPSQGGEALIISELKTRYVSFLGGHAYFHSPNDTVAKAVDADHIARWAHASRSVVDGLLTLEGEAD
jgi:hypothetical protein